MLSPADHPEGDGHPGGPGAVTPRERAHPSRPKRDAGQRPRRTGHTESDDHVAQVPRTVATL